jgi:hypothetical protein
VASSAAPYEAAPYEIVCREGSPGDDIADMIPSRHPDATSFAVMERLRLREACAFDPHFRQYRFLVLGLDSPKP